MWGRVPRSSGWIWPQRATRGEQGALVGGAAGEGRCGAKASGAPPPANGASRAGSTNPLQTSAEEQLDKRKEAMKSVTSRGSRSEYVPFMKIERLTMCRFDLHC